MAPYLLYPNMTAALNASNSYWVQTLGHSIRPGDGTIYLWPWLVGLDGRVALDTAYNPAHIIAPGVVQTLDPVNWPPLKPAPPP